MLSLERGVSSVSMTWGPCRFRLSALILLVAGLVLFGTLGLWQLQRSAQKQALEMQREAATTDGQLPTVAALNDNPEHYRYWPFSGHGRYLPEPQWLLDNQVRDGRPGVEVLSLYELDGETPLLLVNRGWMAPPHQDRAQWQAPSVQGVVSTVSGTLMLPPDVGLRLAEPVEDSLLLQYVSVDALARSLGRPILPLVLRLDATAEQGLDRRWRYADAYGSHKSRAYASQWFSFAAISVVMFLFFACRRAGRNHE